MLTPEPFDIQHLTVWLADLKDALKEIFAQRREAIVIAISRKMPKMFEWLSHQDDKRLNEILIPEYSSTKEFVDSLDITTEYALPFLFKDRDQDSYDVVVVDDIIISGATLRQVSSDICALTGKLPIASSIFKCESIGIFPYAETKYIDKKKPLTQQEADLANSFIAEAILSTALPMDLVFPILHVSEKSAKSIASKIKADKKICSRAYDIKHRNGDISSESIILKEHVYSAYANDFVKIRTFFQQNGNASIVMYAPCIFETDVITGGKIFDSLRFNNAWDIVKKRMQAVNYSEVQKRMNDAIYSYVVEKSIKNRRALSLDAVANYIFSLSLIGLILKNLNLNKEVAFNKSIRENDLHLLFGKEMSEELLPILKSFLTDPEVLYLMREDLVLEQFLCPDKYSNKYNEFRCVFTQTSNNLEETLDKVFDLQRYPSKIGMYISPNSSPENAGIAESFQSMIKLLSIFKSRDLDIETEVNKYIDRKIDEGMVSSYYAFTTSPNKKSYLKRYFRAGANSII